VADAEKSPARVFSDLVDRIRPPGVPRDQRRRFGHGRRHLQLRPGRLVVEAIHTALSLATTFVLFGLMYKILPTVKIEWGQIRLAALATAILFTLGKYLIAIYIGRSDLASVFGAASVVIVIILWVYYSASILLLGAEFSKAYAGIVRGQRSMPRRKAL
jgi:uncharacterized BrkB/YihY/UPF0761 family membrane protein